MKIVLQYRSAHPDTKSIPPEILSSIYSIVIIDIINNKRVSNDTAACLVSATGRPFLSIVSPATPRQSTLQSIFRFLLDICHVCHDWRVEAFNNPSLWSTIYYERTLCNAALSFWIERASFQLLDITLYVKSQYKQHVHMDFRFSSRYNVVTREAQFMQAVNLLVNRSQQWRSFTIAAECTFDLMHVIYHLEAIPSAPKLKRLEIRGDEQRCSAMVPNDDEKWYQEYKSFFHGSHPLLSDVHLYCVPNSWCQGKFASSVRIFGIQSGSPKHMQGDKSLETMLRQADMLHTLSVQADRLYVFSNEGVHLPFLTRLDIEFTDAEFALSFFSAIRPTNLRVLSLSLADDDFSSVLDEISCRTRAENMLGGVEELIVTNLNASALSMDTFLRQLVAVQQITFMITFVGYKTFFKQLMSNAVLLLSADLPFDPRSAESSIFCPKLSAFFSRGLSGAELVDLVEARHKIGRPLDEVHMTMDDFIRPEEHSWLSAQVPRFSSNRYMFVIPERRFNRWYHL